MRLRLCLFSFAILLFFPVSIYADQTLPIPSGLVVSTEAPQASAEALLKLPAVYATPGSWWYWLYHVWEEVQLTFTTDPSKRTDLLLKFSQERLAEGYQAVKTGQFNQAVSVLSDYQHNQTDLATSLDVLQTQSVNVHPFLLRLQQQLAIQQALQQFTQKQTNPNGHKVSQLLEIQPIQMLAFSTANERALLGVSTRRLSTAATASASPSARPQRASTPSQGAKK